MSSLSRSDWLHRLRERGVIRVAASYAVIAWLLLQIADVTFEPLGVPRWVMVSLIVAAVLGFPAAVALAWFYEAGDGGIRRDTAAEGMSRPTVHGARRYADLVIIGVLLATVAVLLVRQSDLAGTGEASPAIAVLPFENLSTAPGGEVLASGIAESVQHQLASLAELDVIARTSSFAFRDRGVDAREIGRQLGARYLLGGTVQSERSRMRVTTQLIDTQTGADVWSMRFDRLPGDIFAIQDEIAMQVTRALELSLAPDAMERMMGQGTKNLEAYLAFLQGRALLGTNRVTDAGKAIEHFEQSLSLDPAFAAAYLGIAEAALFVAEFKVTEDRQARFANAKRRGQELIEKALLLDPENGDAYLQRAHFKAFDDLDAAETDYRRGLELSPNSAKGYAGFATVLYETPARREEALEMLERARRLDPLEPAYDVAKSVFLAYERSDIEGSIALLLDVVKRNPRYTPALARLCENLALSTGQVANGIRYCEEAVALDPLLEETRQVLIRAYLDLGDIPAAEQLVGDDGTRSLRVLPIVMHRRDWREAGEVAYRSLERRTVGPVAMPLACNAIRMHARTTGEYTRAEAALESEAGIMWEATGNAVLPDEGSPTREAAIGLADVLLASGQERKGRELLATILDQMQLELGEGGRSEYWYWSTHPVALALSSDTDAAMAMMERSIERTSSQNRDWFLFEIDPAFAGLRQEPRFQAIRHRMHAQANLQRRELERLRERGLVPRRPD